MSESRERLPLASMLVRIRARADLVGASNVPLAQQELDALLAVVEAAERVYGALYSLGGSDQEIETEIESAGKALGAALAALTTEQKLEEKSG